MRYHGHPSEEQQCKLAPGQSSHHVLAMRAKECQWEVSRLEGKAAKLIGFVYARNERGAVDRAIEQFRITDLPAASQSLARLVPLICVFLTWIVRVPIADRRCPGA